MLTNVTVKGGSDQALSTYTAIHFNNFIFLCHFRNLRV